MNLQFTSALAICVLASAVGATRAGADYPGHEVWFGVGGVTSFEKSVFNVSVDIESHPELFLSLGYMKNLNARRAVGFHVFGGTETPPQGRVQGPDGTRPAISELNTYNIGVRYRHTFSRGTFAPYVLVGLSGANGSIESSDIGTLTYNGITACVGPGVSVGLGRNFKLSAEGIGSFGVASWEAKPFTNSSSRSLNPSLAGGTVNLNAVWGAERAPRPPPGTGIAQRRSILSLTPGFAIEEGCILLLSSAAYANDRGGTLVGLTAASALLGTAAGAGSEFKNPKSVWVVFGGLLAIAGAELVMGQTGASEGALFVTSLVSLNALYFTVSRMERIAKMQR